MRRPLTGLALLLLAACSGQSETGTSSERDLAEVRAAIVAHNYGAAVELARAMAKANPRDANALYELARAEALLGNQGSALDALDAAITAGLGNVPTALADPAFNSIRDSDRFAALADRATPGAADDGPVERLAAGSGADRVEITTDSDGQDTIRAGDVTLSTDF